MVEQAMKEIACWKAESALEKGHGDYNLIGVWCGNVFILGGPPLKDGM
jgi:hypothetical protein